ncbi:pyrroline-5-carboxylate reductase [Bacillus alkalicellulosilyticus]|uniref:pyrroline-5-carboxylate reductase n=1 Tax=Alkalihalobacterium alkalicellulosilyticum TaxID=1912214 RepID=UPI0009961630|nr:pyrroline-5-carboxylate reductase [Bacillus alkalicellulosilyticus]
MLSNKKIAFVGAGSMAESIIAGLLANELLTPDQIIATNKSNQERLSYLEQEYRIQTTSDKATAVSEADVIVLAMKPVHVAEGIAEIRSFTSEQQLFISVLAGISTKHISELLGHEGGVIRTMPNTSAKVGASASAITAGEHASQDQLKLTATLFEAIGTVTIVPEDKIDAVTGLAGSGPAYIYYLVEAMEQAASEIGLEKEEANQLIVQTLAGASKRLQSTSKTAVELYKEVMSPGGTTEAGLKVLAENDFQETMKKAILRAVERSKELGN